jgi:hypothetical protein
VKVGCSMSYCDVFFQWGGGGANVQGRAGGEGERGRGVKLTSRKGRPKNSEKDEMQSSIWRSALASMRFRSSQCFGSGLIDSRSSGSSIFAVPIRIQNRIQIQGFDEHKLELQLNKKKFNTFWFKNWDLLIPMPKDVQATGEAFVPQKRTSSTGTSKQYIPLLFGVTFAHWDPHLADQKHCGSIHADPDPQQF